MKEVGGGVGVQVVTGSWSTKSGLSPGMSFFSFKKRGLKDKNDAGGGGCCLSSKNIRIRG